MVRKALHISHLWLGLISGTLLLVVALTGCMLAFEDEIRYATQHDLLYVEVQERPQINVEQLLAVMKQYDPKMKLNQVRYLGADRAIQVYARDRRRIVAVNPYTGAVLGERDMKKDVLSVILSFHRTLLLDKIGEEIIFWNVWIFLFMLVSGMVIWLPRKVKQLRRNFSLQLKAAPTKRNYDLHRMLGFYAWVPLFLIAITGISMALGGEKGAKMQSTVHGPQSTVSGSIYDRALAEVYHQEPYDMLRVTFPADSTGVINIGIRYATSSFRKQSNFLFDQYTGELLKSESYKDKSFSQTFFGSSYEIHTGRILGISGKIIMFLAGLVALSLPVTGFLVWRSKRASVSTRYCSPAEIF